MFSKQVNPTPAEQGLKSILIMYSNKEQMDINYRRNIMTIKWRIYYVNVLILFVSAIFLLNFHNNNNNNNNNNDTIVMIIIINKKN